MSALVTGDKALIHLMEKIKAASGNKLARPALAAGLRVCVKSMKAAVPANMKDAKKAIGSRFSKSKRTGELMAKAGAAVGVTGLKKTIEKAAEKQKAKRGKRPGVGIGARNIMWFILGTKQRSTGSTRVRSDKTGKTRKLTGKPVHSTGRMPPQMNPVKEGFQRSESSVMQKIIDVARQKLAELAK